MQFRHCLKQNNQCAESDKSVKCTKRPCHGRICFVCSVVRCHVANPPRLLQRLKAAPLCWAALQSGQDPSKAAASFSAMLCNAQFQRGASKAALAWLLPPSSSVAALQSRSSSAWQQLLRKPSGPAVLKWHREVWLWRGRAGRTDTGG